MEDIEQYIEALIFASEQSVTKPEIVTCLQSTINYTLNDKEIEVFFKNITLKYANKNSAIQLVNTGGGYQFLTKEIYYPIVNQLQAQQNKRKLSQAGLETLAIIASKQTATKLDIEHIRGVNSDYTVQKLLEKGLIQVAGKANLPGKPIIFSVSKTFLDHFGLNSLADMPQLKDIEGKQDSEIGVENE